MVSNGSELDHLFTLDDFESEAKRRVSAHAWAFLSTGAGSGISTQQALDSWKRFWLLPRTLAGVAECSSAVSIFEREWKMPIALAPVAAQASFHPEAERATNAGANAAGALMIQSSHSSLGLVESLPGDPRPWWFQLYVHKQRNVTAQLLEEVLSQGPEAVVLTVDSPVIGYRDEDRKQVPLGRPQTMPGQGNSIYPNLKGLRPESSSIPEHLRVHDSIIYPGLDWSDLAWLRAEIPCKLLVKGVLRADEVARYLDAGVDGIVISNHGGRNLETAIPPALALRGIVEATNGRVPCLVDGGIRRGSDVAKALALGASAVLVGRPYIWGLSVAGAAGVQRVLEILNTELQVCMTLLGAGSVGELTPDLLQLNC